MTGLLPAWRGASASLYGEGRSKPADGTVDARAVAEQAVVQYALSAGFINEAQVREAIQLRDAQLRAGFPMDLIQLLGARYLRPDQAVAVGRVYHQALAQAAVGGVAMAAASASVIIKVFLYIGVLLSG